MTKEDPDYLANHAPIDGLLAIFHSASRSESIGGVKLEFLKTLLMGQYTEAQIQSMDQLTVALNTASKSSTITGLGLVVVGIAAVIVAVLGYLK